MKDITIQIIKDYIENKRPPLEVRKKLDIGFTFENNVLEIFEIRPFWQDETKILNIPVAKAKYIKSKKIWKMYWQRANGKWVSYEPNSEVNSIRDVLKEIDSDAYGCFWG